MIKFSERIACSLSFKHNKMKDNITSSLMSNTAELSFNSLAKLASYVKQFNNFQIRNTKPIEYSQLYSWSDINYLINYKNIALLRGYITESNCIPSRKDTGFKKKVHKKLSREIKKCRSLGLLSNSKVIKEDYINAL